MTAKEYLEQAYNLNQRVNSKLEQVAALKNLTTKCNVTLDSMPNNSSKEGLTTAATGCIISALQEEINTDIDRLVSLEREIMTAIEDIENADCRKLLENRYLCFMSWKQIAIQMNYSIGNVFKIHKKALTFVVIPKVDSFG